MNAMQKSTGALSSAYDKYLDSIQAKINSFKAAFQSLSKTVVNGNLLKGIVELGTGALNAINGIVSGLEKIGGIVPILVGLVSSLFASNLSRILKGLSGLPNIIKGFANIANIVRYLSGALAGPLASGGLLGLLANPSTVLAIGTALTAIVFAIASIVNKIQDAHPSLEKLKEDLSGIESEISKLESEKGSNQSRIDELKALGTLTGAQRDELKYLEEQNALLQEQIEFQERLAKVKRTAIVEKARSDTKKWLDEPGMISSSGLPRQNKTGYGGLLQAITLYNQAKEQLEIAWKNDNENDAKKWSEELSRQADIIGEIYQEAIDLKDELYDSDNPRDIALVKELDKAIRTAEHALGIFDQSDFSDALSKLPIDPLTLFGSEIELTAERVEELANKFPWLKTWMQDFGYTAEDVAAQFNAMQFGTDEAANSVEALTDDVTTLSDELERAIDDLKAYSDATSTEKGDTADKYGAAYKKFIEDWEAGKTGSNAVRAAVELFIPDEVLQDLDYDLTAAGELLASDMYQAIFNTEGDYGENFANYIKDNIEKFADVASIIDNGDGTFDFSYESLSGLAEAFGLSENAITALLDCLDKYGVQAMMSAEATRDLAQELNLVGDGANPAATNVEKVMTAITGLAQQGKSSIEIRALLDSLAAAGYIDLEGIEGIGDAISGAVSAAKEAEEAGGNIEITAEDQASEVIGNAVATLEDANGKSATLYVNADASGVYYATVVAGGMVDSFNKKNASATISADDQASDVVDSAVSTLDDADGQSADTTVTTDPSGALSGIATADSALNEIDGKTVTTYVDTVAIGAGGGDSGGGNGSDSSGHSHHGGKFASGTKNAPGGPTLVNELGPELISENGVAYIAGGGKPTIVNLEPHAIVLDAEDTKRALSGGGKTFNGIPIRAAARSLNTASMVLDSGGGKISSRTKDAYLKSQVDAGNITTRQATDIRENRDITSAAALLGAVAGAKTANKNPSAATVPAKDKTDGNSSGSGGGGGGGGSGSSSSKEETWFEKQLAEHKHNVQMDKESQQEYLDWLEQAYKKAYKEGIIDLKEYRKYEEEIYKGRQDDFKDHLNDTEHLIEMEKNGDNNPTVILNLYQKMMADIQKELKKCYAQGLDSTNSYVQYLENTWNTYNDKVKDIHEEAANEAKDQVKDLVDYRIKMLKQYLKNEVDNYKKRISNLKDFYDKQKELLQDAYDEEEYLEEQAEKRKSVSDIRAELAQLENDNSAWAQKRKLKLQEELNDAENDLEKFEKQRALKLAQDEIDKISEAQVEELEKKIEELEEKLNNPKYLYETALNDVRNNSVALYEEMIAYNDAYGTGIQQDVVDMWEEAYKSLKRYHDLYGSYYNGIDLVNATGYVGYSGGQTTMTSYVPKGGYASGTSRAARGLRRFGELGEEYIFQSKDGTKYRMFEYGDKVLDADATNFLYKFATGGGKILSDMASQTKTSSALTSLDRASGFAEIRMGDIIIQGSANEQTVSEIRRVQRDGVNTILKELKRLKK